MDNEISGNVPPTAPRTEGRKKIRIARIEDTRSRQVTFLKRKNGLLKKAMELGILCDCEVAVIIFNTSNGKLFEYSSVDTEKVLQRYATYSGPSERRKKETFNDLSKSKGTSNIPLNEPALAQTAMHAAAAAARRPRPTYKFTGGNSGIQEYSSTGRKLSSGETPVGPFPVHVTAVPSTSNLHSTFEDPLAKRQKLSHTVPVPNPGLATSGVVPPIQLPDLVSGRPSFMPFTPRFSAQLQIPAITPNTASRQISNAFGLPDHTPKLSGLTPALNYGRNPFSVSYGHESTGNEIALNHHQHQTHSQVQEGADNAAKLGSMDFPVAARNDMRSAMEENVIKSGETVHMEKTTHPTRNAGSSDGNHEYTETNTETKNEILAPRAKPNLRVRIPDANRAEEFATGTPSGLNSLTTPSSGDENGSGQLQIPRLNTALTSPTGNMGWPAWNNVANVDRDTPVPLTPFLNMDTLAGPSDMGQGHLALPSPTDAGLIPLTPRGLGLDSLLSNRPSTRSQELGKRPFDFYCDQNRPTDPRRPFN